MKDFNLFRAAQGTCWVAFGALPTTPLLVLPVVFALVLIIVEDLIYERVRRR